MDTAEILAPDTTGITRAAAILAAGGLVAFPTETVYGLGADARNDRAVSAIYAAKGRPAHNPLIVHVRNTAQAEALIAIPPWARALATAYWPGPLSLVGALRPEADIAPTVCAGLPSLAIRVPADPLAQALLDAFDGPIAAPSANLSGQISPTTADHVRKGLGQRIAAIIDGGPCRVGVESTIIDISASQPVLLRPGGLDSAQIERTLGMSLAAHTPGGTITAPGQLRSHYAPRARLRLGASTPRPGEGWLGFGPDPAALDGPYCNLSPRGDLSEAAARLFACLHRLDHAMGGQGVIAVAPIPPEGLGQAINDRLVRAAADR